MPDLFSPVARPSPAAVPPQSPDPEPAVTRTFRRVKLKSHLLGIDYHPGEPVVADVYLHPCGVCGDPVAPFGSDVYLLTAIATGNDRYGGTWACAKHHFGET